MPADDVKLITYKINELGSDIAEVKGIVQEYKKALEDHTDSDRTHFETIERRLIAVGVCVLTILALKTPDVIGFIKSFL